MSVSPDLAERTVRAIYQRGLSLIDFPETGAPRDQIAPGLRIVFAGVHGVYYRNLPDSVTIVRIIDGRRDLEAIGDWDLPPNPA